MLPLLAVLAANGGAILEARLEAAVTEGPDVAVRLAYRVEPSTAGTDESVPFSALEVEGVAIEDLEAFADETPVPVTLEARSGPKREGWIPLPYGTSTLELHYVVRRAVDRTARGLRVRLPLLILGWQLEETRAGLFSSVVEIPAGLSIIDGFPSRSLGGAGGAHRSELPLVPTFLSFGATSEDSLFTPARAATLAVVILLLGGGFLGFRRMRAFRG